MVSGWICYVSPAKGLRVQPSRHFAVMFGAKRQSPAGCLEPLAPNPLVTLAFFPQFKHKGVLSKYDEEIEGERKKSFKLDAVGMADGSRERELQNIRDSLQSRAQSLDLPSVHLASEYYTPEEMVGWVRPGEAGRLQRKNPGLVGLGKGPSLDGVPGCLGSLPWRGWEARGAIWVAVGLAKGTVLLDS